MRSSLHSKYREEGELRLLGSNMWESENLTWSSLIHLRAAMRSKFHRNESWSYEVVSFIKSVQFRLNRNCLTWHVACACFNSIYQINDVCFVLLKRRVSERCEWIIRKRSDHQTSPHHNRTSINSTISHDIVLRSIYQLSEVSTSSQKKTLLFLLIILFTFYTKNKNDDETEN